MDEIFVSPNGFISNQIQNFQNMEMGSVAKEVSTKK